MAWAAARVTGAAGAHGPSPPTARSLLSPPPSPASPTASPTRPVPPRCSNYSTSTARLRFPAEPKQTISGAALAILHACQQLGPQGSNAPRSAGLTTKYRTRQPVAAASHVASGTCTMSGVSHTVLTLSVSKMACMPTRVPGGWSGQGTRGHTKVRSREDAEAERGGVAGAYHSNGLCGLIIPARRVTKIGPGEKEGPIHAGRGMRSRRRQRWRQRRRHIRRRRRAQLITC